MDIGNPDLTSFLYIEREDHFLRRVGIRRFINDHPCTLVSFVNEIFDDVFLGRQTHVVCNNAGFEETYLVFELIGFRFADAFKLKISQHGPFHCIDFNPNIVVFQLGDIDVDVREHVLRPKLGNRLGKNIATRKGHFITHGHSGNGNNNSSIKSLVSFDLNVCNGVFAGVLGRINSQKGRIYRSFGKGIVLSKNAVRKHK